MQRLTSHGDVSVQQVLESGHAILGDLANERLPKRTGYGLVSTLLLKMVSFPAANVQMMIDRKSVV